MESSELTNKPIGVRLLRSLLIGSGLLLFNVVFILGPYLALWGLIIGSFAAGLSLMVTSIALMASSFFSLSLNISLPLVLIDHTPLIFLASGLLFGLGGLLTGLVLWPIKYLCIYTAKYVKWQFQLIRGDQNV